MDDEACFWRLNTIRWLVSPVHTQAPALEVVSQDVTSRAKGNENREVGEGPCAPTREGRWALHPSPLFLLSLPSHSPAGLDHFTLLTAH